MTERAANLNVAIAAQLVNNKAKQSAMQVLTSGGTSQQTSELTLHILQELSGRRIPRLGFCPGSIAEALRYFRDDLGQAVVSAQDAIASLGSQLADTNSALSQAKSTVDGLLGANPDPATPRSVDELTDSIGGLRPTSDREALEQRVGEVLDLNIVNGVLFPKGATQLGPLRQLVQSLGVQPGEDLTERLGAASGTDSEPSAAAEAGSADGAVDQTGAGDGFLLVTTTSETIERVVGSTCGEDIVEFEVVTTPLGTNQSIDALAAAAGVDPNDLGLQLFWLDEIRTDPATLKRLRALGLTPEEVGAVMTAGPSGASAGRVTSTTVDTSVVSSLRYILTDDEIVTLLSRPNTASGINVAPTFEDVLSTLQNALNTNTGGNRNRAGTDSEAIESGQAGRGGDPVMLLFGLFDFLRLLWLSFRALFSSFNFGLTLPLDFGANLAAVGLSLNLSDECQAILSVVTESINGLRPMFDEAQAFVRDLFGQVGLGNHAISAGVDFASCLISFNLGLDFSISLSLSLPFVMEVYLAAFTTMLAGFITAVAAIRSALCIPQAVIQLLFGGVCGFKPFDFTICEPDIATLVDRLVAMLNLAIQLVTKLGNAVFSMKVDAERVLAAANQFKGFSPCALSATGIGLALGLGDTSAVAGGTATTT